MKTENSKLKIFFASDHAGFEMKKALIEYVKELGYETEDCGAYELNPEDDYPEFIKRAAQAISNDPENSKAIILGGSGQGEAMAANRFPNVRAVVFYGPYYNTNQIFPVFFRAFDVLKLSREHNDANVLSIGARFVPLKFAKKVVKIWLETPFSNEERHIHRISQIEN